MSDGHRAPGPTIDAEAFADLIESAAQLAFTAESVPDAYQWAVDEVCEFTGWPVGHVLVHDPYGGGLVSSGVWHVDDRDRFAPFVEESDAIRFKPGEGLPGRVLVSERGAWIVDVRTDDNFPRKHSATQCGLAAAFAFPIRSRTGIDGIMEFFSTESLPPAETYIRLIASIGITVAHIAEQARARTELAASEARLAEAQRIAKLGSWSWSVGADTAHLSDELYRILGLQPGAARESFDLYAERVHPDDQDRVLEVVERLLTSGEPFDLEHRIVQPGGAELRVTAHGEVAARHDGLPDRLIGYARELAD